MKIVTWRALLLSGAFLPMALAFSGSLVAQEAPAGEKPKAAPAAGDPAAPPQAASTKPLPGGFDSSYLGSADQKPAENQDYITLDVKDKDLAEVLRFISRQVGVNIVPDPDIKEKVTIELDRVEWRKALEVIARLTHSKIVEESERLIRFTQPPSISMEFQEADIKVVLELLAKQAGANILIASDVKGKVSLSLREVPWQEALDAVVKTAGYTTVMETTPHTEIIRVVRPESLKDQLETRSFKLRYARPPDRYEAKISDVEKVAESVSPFSGTAGDLEAKAAGKGPATSTEPAQFTLFTALQRVVSKEGSLDYDVYTNTFIVKETKPRLDEIENIIKTVDIQPPLIFVEVKFISTKNTDLLERGIKFDLGGTPETDGLIVSARGAAPDTTSTDPLFRFGGTFPFDIGRIDRVPKDFAALGILDFTQLQAVLRMVKNDINSRLLQEPTLTMVNGRPATIFVGDNVPFAVQKIQQDQNGNITAAIDENKRSPIDVGFTLHVTPHWIPDTDLVDMSIIPKVSSLSGETSPAIPGFDRFQFTQQGAATSSIIDLPRVASQTVVTYLRVQSGHTAVIGGLNTENRKEQVSKIPLLSSIPVLGNLFTWKRKTNEVDSLIILITPHLLKSPEEAKRQFDGALKRNQEKDYFYNRYEKDKPAKAEIGK
jgi:type IV pilus assembly protein PilQ